jgi:DNA (cytosine-5)-methyltransferase 1
MTRPRLLDLFCGAGGAAVGYHRAGFDVTGVDVVMHRGYPFERSQADALDVLADWDLSGYDAIHASPPCMRFSAAATRGRRGAEAHPDLLTPCRELLQRTGKPWVIENVPRSPVRPDYKLCGCMFDLPNLKRERWFETSWRGFDLRAPCQHLEPVITVVANGSRQSHEKDRWPREQALLHPIRARAMGINWIPPDNRGRTELGLAIPPAYTEYIGAQLLGHLKETAA